MHTSTLDFFPMLYAEFLWFHALLTEMSTQPYRSVSVDLRKINFDLVEQTLAKTMVTEANDLKSILGFGILGVEYQEKIQFWRMK